MGCVEKAGDGHFVLISPHEPNQAATTSPTTTTTAAPPTVATSGVADRWMLQDGKRLGRHVGERVEVQGQVSDEQPNEIAPNLESKRPNPGGEPEHLLHVTSIKTLASSCR